MFFVAVKNPLIGNSAYLSVSFLVAWFYITFIIALLKIIRASFLVCPGGVVIPSMGTDMSFKSKTLVEVRVVP